MDRQHIQVPVQILGHICTETENTSVQTPEDTSVQILRTHLYRHRGHICTDTVETSVQTHSSVIRLSIWPRTTQGNGFRYLTSSLLLARNMNMRRGHGTSSLKVKHLWHTATVYLSEVANVKTTTDPPSPIHYLCEYIYTHTTHSQLMCTIIIITVL